MEFRSVRSLYWWYLLSNLKLLDVVRAKNFALFALSFVEANRFLSSTYLGAKKEEYSRLFFFPPFKSSYRGLTDPQVSATVSCHRIVHGPCLKMKEVGNA